MKLTRSFLPSLARARTLASFAAASAFLLFSHARASVPVLLDGATDVAYWKQVPWTLQKTGAYVAGTPAGSGAVNWTVTVTRGTETGHFAVMGFLEMTSVNSEIVTLESMVLNLQTVVNGDWKTISSDIVTSAQGDAATQATVDGIMTYEGVSTFTENSGSGSFTFSDEQGAPVLLNAPALTLSEGQNRRIYFVARFNPTVLNLSEGMPVQIEAIATFANNGDVPTSAVLREAIIPEPVVANNSVLLTDPSITTSGTVTAGTFTPLEEILTQGGSFSLSVPVQGGSAGGSVCNTAHLFSAPTVINFERFDGVLMPLISIPGINLSATNCQEVPKRPGEPKPISTTINSCSQVVTYDASLFTSPAGPIVSASFSPASGSTFPFGTSQVGYTVVDSEGNTATGFLTVNVIDLEAPVIAPIATITLAAQPGSCGAVATFATTATDCNLQSVTYSHASGSTFPVGTTVVTVTATDTAGHQATRTFSVVVSDVTAPVITIGNITVNAAQGSCAANVEFNATTLDCTGVALVYSLSPTFSPAIASGASFPIGTTTVYVQATDAAGNVAASSFTVTVKDVDAPVISVTNVVAANTPGACGAIVHLNGSGADCSAFTLQYFLDAGFTTQVGSEANFPVGVTTVYVKAVDASGNTSSASFTVTVKDTEAPTITSPLVNLNLTASLSTCSAVFTYAPAAVDNCAGAVSVTVSPASGTILAAGTTTTVTVTATDSAGNSTTASFTVTVSGCGTMTTFTQGGWGAKPSGNNPGTVLWRHFSSVFPNGLVVGGNGGTYTLKFTTASAITDAMPMSGNVGVLTKNYVNSSVKNTFASQLVALTLNVGFSAKGVFSTPVKLGDMKIATGKLQGWTVNQFLAMANTVLGGKTSALPAGVSIGDLTDVAAKINENFDDGTRNNGFLTY